MQTRERSKAAVWAAALALGAAALGCSAEGTARAGRAVQPLVVNNSVEEYNAALACPVGGPCLSAGTEIQDITMSAGTVFAATTTWYEKATVLWPGAGQPGRSAEVLRRTPMGAWEATEPLPGTCGDEAAWEQVNDLYPFTYGGVSQMFVATTPNRDNLAACPDLRATVFVGTGAPGAMWTDTGLGTQRLYDYYRGVSSNPVTAEVRYLAMSTTIVGCSAAHPCLFAMAGLKVRNDPTPRPNPPAATNQCVQPAMRGFATHYYATVWRGILSNAGGAPSVAWDAAPSLDLDGVGMLAGQQKPDANRIVSVETAPDGSLLIGTSEIPSQVVGMPAGQDVSAVLRLDPMNNWSVVFTSSAPDDEEVRGIETVAGPNGTTVWWVTSPAGRVFRLDNPGQPNAVLTPEVHLRTDPAFNCNGFLAYHLQLLQAPAGQLPRLFIGTESCNPRGGAASAFVRPVDLANPAAAAWDKVDFPNILDAMASPRAREDALRWMFQNPQNPCQILLGTSDSNSQCSAVPGENISRTARIFRAAAPFPPGVCPAP